MSMNPRTTTEKIRSDYQEYVASILSVRDPKITQLAHEAVKNTGFVKGPYLETTLPFVEGKSLKELAEEGLVSKEFGKMGPAIHYEEWKLRIHQERALRHIIEEKRNMVVSTGTGSGKTECYLYPIFNSLMREKENGTLNPGVRALLIFPMNALANDQQKKLRKLLKEYPDITFGRYTGETLHAKEKESPEEAEERMHHEYDMNHQDDSDVDQRKSIRNEMMCREMMAKRPPHILLTNYAMLEYMLLRPDTAPFFDNESAQHWTYLVIDEAHTYKGATGTEIAFLLRRLKERIRRNMKDSFRCIATSATLGNDAGSAKKLAEFASAMFDEPFEEEDVITTERAKRVPANDCRNFMPADYIELKKQAQQFDEDEKGKFLYEKLSKDLRLFVIYQALSGRPKRIEEVASDVFPDITSEADKEAGLIDLIELAAAAKKSAYESALLPARYHLFIKSLEGMFAQYYPQRYVYLDRREKVSIENRDYSVFELANCQKCGQEYLVGKTIPKNDKDYLVQTSSMEKPEYFFMSDSLNADAFEDFDEDDVLEQNNSFSRLEKYHLCLCCGRIKPYEEKISYNCCKNPDNRKVVTVYKLEYRGKDNESNCCPCCGATQKGLIKRFLTANQPATLAVAKSLYDAIPPRSVSQVPKSTDDPDDLFGDFWDSEEDYEEPVMMDESGRKLLIFSDNRQEAAFFAGFFEKKYRQIMWRKLILRCLEQRKEAISMEDLIIELNLEAEKLGLYSYDQELQSMSNDHKIRMAASYLMQEFINPDISTGLEGMGFIQIYPEPMKMNPGIEIAGLHGEDVWKIFRFMMDTLRAKGAVTFPEKIKITDDFFAPRNHNAYFQCSDGDRAKDGGCIFGFTPKPKYNNKRLSFMKKLPKYRSMENEQKDKSAREDLNGIYQAIEKLKGRGYIVTTNNNTGTCHQLNYKKWKVKYIQDDETIYRCRKCGKIFHYSIGDLCQEMKCDGTLEKITAGQVKKAPYYNRLYKDDSFIPMVAREHTAQLSHDTAGEYQKGFEEGKINVLSCSTTFEMGVDVGELEATFQRNVPPETSNYIQRAGRAGRRTSSAAFSVTFCRRASHDMTFFQNPPQIIAGKISAPVLETDNEKIAQRHMNSIIVSWFFKKHPEFFEQRTRRVVAFGQSENMASVLRQILEEHPQELLDSIHAVLSPEICQQLGVDGWTFIEQLTGKDGLLTRAIEERANDINGLTICQQECAKAEKYGRAHAAKKLINTLEEESTISFLSSKGVLPKYGFPIDTVSLDVISGQPEDAKKIDLSRDLRMAISEFAPPAEIVANGKVWKSYAINTIPDRSWPTYIYHECPNCKRIYAPDTGMTDINAELKDKEPLVCRSCGKILNPKKFIIPMFGFSTKLEDEPTSVGDSRPRAYYGTQTQFWGIDGRTEQQKAEAEQKFLNIKGKQIDITYSPGGKLFVLNQGRGGRGLCVCPSCGYATDLLSLRKNNNNHVTKFNRKCNNKHLVSVSLGHQFSTDILKIILPHYYIPGQTGENIDEKDQYLSTMYAILEGASVALDISRDDINGCVTGDGEIILFDDTPGGSGFVKSIYQNFEKVLESAKEKVSGICGCSSETSCYGCLRNYSNQLYHDKLSRGLAYFYLDWILNGESKNPSVQSLVPVSDDGSFDDDAVPGNKVAIYSVPNDGNAGDTVETLSEIVDDYEAEERDAILRLIDYAKGKNFSDMCIDTKIEVANSGMGQIWPEFFWASSKVAIFRNNCREQYEEMKNFDWYCYLLDENLRAEKVFSHVKKVEE